MRTFTPRTAEMSQTKGGMGQKKSGKTDRPASAMRTTSNVRRCACVTPGEGYVLSGPDTTS